MDGCLARTITKIEANPLLVRGKSDFRIMRVAAYCRVSTDDEDQLNSYQAQIAYYTDAIAKRPNSTFAGIYADEGITGTSTKKRKDFLRLMRDCERGKVDYILTKSISRFARNTVDSLSWVRKLRAMGIGVYFEEQAIDSLKAENETLIGLFSVIAQSESENIGANVRWGIRQSMKSGTYCTNFSCFGYRRGDDGVPVIVPEEAETVRTIFKLFLDGKSIQMICRYLAENNIQTYTGKTEWNQRTVRDLITNEKYVGDLLLQKSYIEDTISKKTRKNNGELAKYLISNNHPAIVDRDTFNMAQAELAGRTNKRKKSELGITEQGKYSAKYALTDVLVCGCCGSHYRRTGKNVKGEVQHVWRCLGRIEHRCKEAVGLEEKKLHSAICRCLSDMMDSREEVINLCRTNLQYALTGDTKVLDAYAIENQIRTHQDEIDLLMEKEETTQGDPERYEKAIVGLYEKIGVLREQLRLAKEQAATNESIQSEIERFMKTIQEYSGDSFTEYDDTVVRRLVECIKVSPDRTVEIILKGGIHGKEKV